MSSTPRGQQPGTPPSGPPVPVAPPPARGRFGALPAHLGRARTSTVVLAGLFIGIFVLWLYVRPAPAQTAPTGGGTAVQTAAPARTTAPERTTPPAETTGTTPASSSPTSTPTATPTSTPTAAATSPTATGSPTTGSPTTGAPTTGGTTSTGSARATTTGTATTAAPPG